MTAAPFAGGKYLVGVGVRGNAAFAHRNDPDGGQLAIMDHVLRNGLAASEGLRYDLISSCQNVDVDNPIAEFQAIRKTVGHADTSVPVTLKCAADKCPSNVAQLCLEDGPEIAPLGLNAAMRMSRVPVFFDATDTTLQSAPNGGTATAAALALRENFYAMHKRWGAGDGQPCAADSAAATAATCADTTTGSYYNACLTEDTINAPQGGALRCAALTNEPVDCALPAGWWSGGVRKENIYLAKRGGLDQVLCLRVQGDKATSGLPGLVPAFSLAESDVTAVALKSAGSRMPSDQITGRVMSCETAAVYPDRAKTAWQPGPRRVGAVLTTAKNYGSGWFSVCARVPPGNAQEVGGMGYVFAMWTFHYSEVYPQTNSADPAAQTVRGNSSATPQGMQHMEGLLNNRYSCGLWSHNCDTTAAACSVQGKHCVKNGGPYTVHNHEIDIEIPTNSGRVPKPAGQPYWQSTSMNVNTWISDDQDYRDTSPYRNVGVLRYDGKGFTASQDAAFHWYSIKWCSGDDSASPPVPPYVEVYFDHERVQAVTDAFIPSRAGKLNIGPWFGWWGGSPDFDTLEVWIKHVVIMPYAAATDPWLPPGGDVATVDTMRSVYTKATSGWSPAPPPAALMVNDADLAAAHNDINANQVFDQCGVSAFRNISGFASFLVDGVDVPEGTIPSGQVLAGPEPATCAWPTLAQIVVPSATSKPSSDTDWGYLTNQWVASTLPRHDYVDVDTDPDPDWVSRVALWPELDAPPAAPGASLDTSDMPSMPSAAGGGLPSTGTWMMTASQSNVSSSSSDSSSDSDADTNSNAASLTSSLSSQDVALLVTAGVALLAALIIGLLLLCRRHQ